MRIVAALLLALAAVPTLAAEPPSVDTLVDSLSRGIPSRTLVVGEAPPPSVMLDVKFEHDSSVIDPAAAELLSRLGQALVSDKLAGDRFLVLGHTNKVGKAGYNQGLSERRAAAVRRFLEESYPGTKGRLETKGAGFTKPVAADPADPANRRVEVINVTGR